VLRNTCATVLETAHGFAKSVYPPTEE